MIKFLKRAVLFLLLLLVGLYFVRNYLAARAVEIGVKTETGFPLQIGAVDLGLFGGTLEVRDLKLANPREFDEKRFVDLPLFKADYDTLAMLRGRPHIKELVVNVSEIVIVTNPDGKTNATILQDKLAPSSQPGAAAPKPTETKKKQYRLDLVRVHIGTVILKDYTKAQPTEKKFTLNRDVVFKDVTESASIQALVMNAVFGPVGDLVPGLVKGLSSGAKGAGEALQQTGKGLFDSLKKAVPGK